MDRKEPGLRERGVRGSLGAGVGFSTAGCWAFPDGAAGGDSSARTGAGSSTDGCWDSSDGTTDDDSSARTGAGSSTAGGWDFRDDHHLADSDRSVFCSADSSILLSEAAGVSRYARSLWVGG